MGLDEQDEYYPDVVPNDLFDDEPDDDWFDISDVVNIHINKDEY